MKKVLAIVVCLLMVFAVYLTLNTASDSTPEATAGKMYKGTFYVAGMGGHFAAAKLTIDPSNKANPISIDSLDRIVIGGKSTHPTHDPRIDVNDRTKMYWSTYKIDKSIGGKTVHVGLSDLTTGQVLIDRAAQLDARAKWTGALYCASGQTKNSYMPVTMTDEAYIDVFSKGDMNFNHRVFLDYKPGETLFYHGINTPDMKKFAIAINRKGDNGKPNGKIDFKLLDLKSLENGKAKVLKETTVTGKPGKTLTFRQTVTPNGKYLLQSAADRFLLMDAKSLKVLDEEMMDQGQNHDAITTPDGKYAVLTIRTKIKTKLDAEDVKGSQITDGELLLYDIKAKKVIGKSASVCFACHKDLGINGNATLCGADANWN
ncbi:hypothetical protein ACFLZI_01610 [Nitrospirota bacterium]